MDFKEIEKLMHAMEHSKIQRLVIKREGFEIELEREGISPMMPPMQMISSPLMHPPVERMLSREQAVVPELPAKREAEGQYITSPMVGTLYLTPSPDDPTFVKVGDLVDPSTVVCIIEAMKVMNEVKAQVQGTIVEVLVKSGEPVEYGTKIFRVSV